MSEQNSSYAALIARYEKMAADIERVSTLAEAEPILREADALYEQCQGEIARLRTIAERLRQET